MRLLLASLLIGAILISEKSLAQELSGLSENEPITLSGGFGLNQVLFYTKDTFSVKEPYTYVLNGNLNATIYGIISCPISFTYSNYGDNFSHPFNFNQFGMQPSYKWLKTYIGYNSMNFSPYTLSGH